MKFVTTIIFLVTSTLSYAATPESLSSNMLEKFMAGDIEGSVSALMDENSHSTKNDSTRLKAEKILGDLVDAAGKPTDYELIKKEKIGRRIEGRTYVLHHEKSSASMVLVYIKQGDIWALKHLNIDLNFTDKFADKLKSIY